MEDSFFNRPGKNILMVNKFPTEKSSNLKHLTLGTSSGGSFIHTRVISWGNGKKHSRLVDNMKLSTNWRQQINMNPDNLYRASRNFNASELFKEASLFWCF